MYSCISQISIIIRQSILRVMVHRQSSLSTWTVEQTEVKSDVILPQNPLAYKFHWLRPLLSKKYETSSIASLKLFSCGACAGTGSSTSLSSDSITSVSSVDDSCVM